MIHVVVVEDDAMNALLFRKLLEKRCGYRVSVTESPEQLLELVLATAHAMRGDAETLLSESGADGYLSKPIVDHGAFVEQIQRSVRAEAA
jgi:CheY-like chemotaxis protein